MQISLTGQTSPTCRKNSIQILFILYLGYVRFSHDWLAAPVRTAAHIVSAGVAWSSWFDKIGDAMDCGGTCDTCNDSEAYDELWGARGSSTHRVFCRPWQVIADCEGFCWVGAVIARFRCPSKLGSHLTERRNHQVFSQANLNFHMICFNPNRYEPF